MSDQFITYELDGPVAMIGLNRASKRNALNLALLEQLDQAALRAADEAKVGVIFGHGEHFCAGLDLAELLDRAPGAGGRRRPWRAPTFAAIGRGAIPFVAALQGAVIGGGLEIAAACQLRVADETAYFALPEAQRGIFTGGGGSVRIARLITVARMQDMMLTGRVLKVDEAERYGVVQYVVAKGQALAKAKELAEKICRNAPLSNFAITNSLPRLQDVSYDDGLFFERMVAEYTRSPESIERLAEFLDKSAARVRPE
jgi:enoyl-CoA hydratase/carnithine racemase